MSTIYTLTNSISNITIQNYNKLYSLKDGKVEDNRLLKIGKEIRVTFTGKEESMLRKLKELESRDKGLKNQGYILQHMPTTL